MAHSPDIPSLLQWNCNPLEGLPLRPVPYQAPDEILNPPLAQDSQDKDHWDYEYDHSTGNGVATEYNQFHTSGNETNNSVALSFDPQTLADLSDFDPNILINFINEGMELRPVCIYHYEFPDRNALKLYFLAINGLNTYSMQVFIAIISAINNLKFTYDMTTRRSQQPYNTCLAQRQLAWLALFESIPESMVSIIGPHEHVKTGIVISAEVFSLGLLHVYARGVVWILENLALGGPDSRDMSDESKVWFFLRRDLEVLLGECLNELGEVRMWQGRKAEMVFIMAEDEKEGEEGGEGEEEEDEDGDDELSDDSDDD